MHQIESEGRNARQQRRDAVKRREFIAAGAAAGWLSLGHAARAEDEMRVTLTNDLWAIVLEPRTLRIMASPVGREAVTLSVGTSPGNVDDLVHGEAKASWTLRRGAAAYRLSCELRGRDLELAITALQPGLLTILSQPASALGRGAMLPIA